MGFVAVLPNYSRLPYGDIEDMIDDIDQAFEWVPNHIERFGGDPNQIMLAGHSAGLVLFFCSVIIVGFDQVGLFQKKKNI